MKHLNLKILFTILFLSGAALAQTSWLDRPLRNWNNGNGIVPNAPRTLVALEPKCMAQTRNPESIADRAVTRAGWTLYGATQIYGSVSLVQGLAGFDGMCRPTLYNTFIFDGSRFVGTISPDEMNSRSDASLITATLQDTKTISAEFNRYTSNDALCCPSQKTYVNYSIKGGARPTVEATSVTTAETCGTGGGVTTMENVITGTITTRQRFSVPSTAVAIVKLMDVSRSDASGIVLNEQRINLRNNDGPLTFEFAYDQKKVNERGRYAVSAEIRDGSKLLYVTETSYPVITQGNPRTVELIVVPVGGGNAGGGRANLVRGTISYLQRIALEPNSEVIVRLVDSADPSGTPVSESKFATNGKQVPIPYELSYEQRDVNRQRNYELQAEIRSNGELRFKTESGKPVDLRGNRSDVVDLILVPARDEPVAITGRSVSLSKFGTGTLQVSGGSGTFLISGSVTVQTNGDAKVSVSGITGGGSFDGKLTYFDDTTMRITVTGSGDTDASGEIEVKYSGRTLRSLLGNNLILDGQNVTLRL